MYTHEFNITCMQCVEMLLLREDKSAKTFVTVIPRKFIPAKYTTYMVYAPCLFGFNGFTLLVIVVHVHASTCSSRYQLILVIIC